MERNIEIFRSFLGGAFLKIHTHPSRYPLGKYMILRAVTCGLVKRT